MPASKNSKTSRRSDGGLVPTLAAFAIAAAVLASAVAYFSRAGVLLYYGDAEAHLNIARRILDSRTPGPYQLGTTWLPLPHLAMLPFVGDDQLWRSGLAGAIPAAAAMALAATFLFAATRFVFDSVYAGWTAFFVFLLNPNTLYLGSIPMSEAFFYASLFALLFSSTRFAKTNGRLALIAAGIAACTATLSRYEGWFVLPFAATLVFFTARRGRTLHTAIFCLIAGLGPLLWLAHQRYYYGDPLYFYRGPYSAIAIQGSKTYPGLHDWRQALHYYLTAGRLIMGWPTVAIGGAGLVAAIAGVRRRVLWPIALLALPPLFIVWSMHSASTPIFVPTLWPFSWYNTRYGLALLPLAALGAAALGRSNRKAAALVAAVSLSGFLIHPGEPSITRQESDVNSRARREWTRKAAAWLSANALPADTYFTSFNDLTGVYRTLGVPLRKTLTGDNEAEWYGAAQRPDLFLHADWAVVQGGDEVQGVIDRARLHGPRFELADRIAVKGAPVLEIYRRIGPTPR